MALLAAQLQLRHARHEREAAERAERQGKGAAVVAPVLSLLSDSEPQRLTATPGSQTLTLMNELLERWKALRDPIVEFAAGYPSPRIGEATDKVVLAVTNALTTAHWLIHDLPESSVEGVTRDSAGGNAEAVKLTRALLEAIRTGDTS